MSQESIAFTHQCLFIGTGSSTDYMGVKVCKNWYIFSQCQLGQKTTSLKMNNIREGGVLKRRLYLSCTSIICA